MPFDVSMISDQILISRGVAGASYCRADSLMCWFGLFTTDNKTLRIL